MASLDSHLHTPFSMQDTKKVDKFLKPMEEYVELHKVEQRLESLNQEISAGDLQLADYKDNYKAISMVMDIQLKWDFQPSRELTRGTLGILR